MLCSDLFIFQETLSRDALTDCSASTPAVFIVLNVYQCRAPINIDGSNDKVEGKLYMVFNVFTINILKRLVCIYIQPLSFLIPLNKTQCNQLPPESPIRVQL
ncbi:hypothetical protein ILYODFUR_015304 [Ilyodon furcidens]|uniref:Uncharacterized protein n=1 Tax=Ilyodon furcidens TaxID=33524 RepID=A0ABV0VE82_9TELE